MCIMFTVKSLETKLCKISCGPRITTWEPYYNKGTLYHLSLVDKQMDSNIFSFNGVSVNDLVPPLCEYDLIFWECIIKCCNSSL